MSHSDPRSCPDCDGVSRRDFLKGVGGAAVAAAAASLPVWATARPSMAAAGSTDSMITQLYGSLNEAHKKAVCFGWEHPKRLAIANNWHIVPQTIGEFYTPEQQDLITQIFKASHSEQWVAQRLKQIQDDGGGIKNYNIAMFGEPGSGKFEWVFTGRHLTLRQDGDSEPGVAFGGPIFYGHAAASGFNETKDHPGNVYWYQALRANEVYKALDGKQQAKALVVGPVPAESPKLLVARPAEQRAGIPVSDMSRDQQELVEKVLGDLMAPMNVQDVAEARKYLTANGGVKSLHMAFYKQDDIGEDGVWDVWRLEGPTMTWYFRGHPHVHTWVYIREQPLKTAYPGPNG